MLNLSADFVWIIVFACFFAQAAHASRESKLQWAWVDESCFKRTGDLKKAFEEYLEFTEVVHESLGDKITQVGKATLKAFFGEVDPTGLLIQSEPLP